jgi:Cu/Ag efflux protein CusF
VHASAPGTGTINAVNPAARTINVTHGPIPALGWPSMTMDFQVGPAVDVQTLRPGAHINFMIEHAEGGGYIIRSVAPAGARR